jgi:hypothetical protein
MDSVLIPALTMALQHRAQDDITEDDYHFILEATAEIVQQFRVARKPADESALPIVGFATRTPVDQLLLEMLCLAVNSSEMRFKPVNAELDAAGALDAAVGLAPDLVCIASLSPTRGSEVRNYCRQLRAARPETKLLVLRPNVADTDVSRSAARMKEAGADCVVTNIAEALQGIEQLCPSCPPVTNAEPELIAEDKSEPAPARSFATVR